MLQINLASTAWWWKRIILKKSQGLKRHLLVILVLQNQSRIKKNTAIEIWVYFYAQTWPKNMTFQLSSSLMLLQKKFQSIVCSWIGEKQIKDIKKASSPYLKWRWSGPGSCRSSDPFGLMACLELCSSCRIRSSRLRMRMGAACPEPADPSGPSSFSRELTFMACCCFCAAAAAPWANAATTAAWDGGAPIGPEGPGIRPRLAPYSK